MPPPAPSEPYATAPDATWRTFELTTRVVVNGARGPTRVWLPTPQAVATPWQQPLGGTSVVTGGEVTRVTDPAWGLDAVVAEWADGAAGPGGEAPTLSRIDRVATRGHAVDLTTPAKAVATEDLARFLAPTALLPTDGVVLATAREITRGARGDLEQARAIYEWIFAHTSRDAATRGCGVGDIRTMLESGRLQGKCADLNALFVGLARAAGLPARELFGLRVAPSAHGYTSIGVGGPNVSKAQHCRAEVHLSGFGWVPVDPADVRKVVLEEPPGALPLDHEKVTAAKARLFGSWDMNWFAYNYAHDLVLPGAARARLPFFMYPQGQTADGPLDSYDPDRFGYVLTVREL